MGYFVNGVPKYIEVALSDDQFEIPVEAFEHFGMLSIALALVDKDDSNHIEVTKEIMFQVTPAPGGMAVLPVDEDTWQSVVESFVEQFLDESVPTFEYMQKNYLAKTASATDEERTMSGDLILASGVAVSGAESSETLRDLIQLNNSNVQVGNTNNALQLYGSTRPTINAGGSNQSVAYLSDLNSINSAITTINQKIDELQELADKAVYYEDD